MEAASVVIVVGCMDPNEDLKEFVVDKAECLIDPFTFNWIWKIRCDPVTASLILLKFPR